jgi:RecA-family ATPase
MPVYTVGSQSDLPKSVMDYLANGASKGERNQKLFGAACQCRDCGLSQSVTETCLLDRAKNDGLSAAEARKTIESAYDRSARQPAHGAHGGNTAPSPSPASSNGQWPSPVPLPVPTGLDLAVLMVNLFRQDEGIAIGVGSRKPGGELEIDAGVVKTWDQWQKCAPPLAEWNQGDGLFYRINPMKRGGKKDEHLTAFRHALVEFDLDAKGERISKEVQFAFVLKFNLPVIALVDSGDKSLHAIVRLDAADRAQFDERLGVIFSLFPEHSVDSSNKNPSRYTRLPGFLREKGKEPQVLAINLGPPDYATWEKQRPAGQSDLAAACVSGAAFLDLVIPPKEIIVDDWLKEGEVGYLYAFRGVGKTWMVLEFAVSIALGRNFGPWKVLKPCPVLYVDGEMSYHDIRERILSLVGEIPKNLSILNHEVLFHATGKTMNFAESAQQQELLRLAVAQGIKVPLFDNISCLFTGVDEDKSREWERVKPWLLDMRRHRISPVLIHHTGYDLSHMRGTSSREDAASWVMRLDSKKDDFETLGANFISRFTKYRGKRHLFDYEWTFGPDSADSDKVKVYYKIANRAEVLLQWVRDGLTSCADIAKEMGLSKGRVSQIATQLIKAGKLRKRKNDYEPI